MMIPNCETSLGKRQLGRSGIQVSELSVGTVELGMDYGISVPGDYGKPSKGEAIQLLHRAADAGVTVFDTAPGYGESERVLGEALGADLQCLFATKVPVPRENNGKLLHGEPGKRQIDQSLARSLKALNRDTLDIVQIHNATVEVLEQSDILALLDRAKQCGLIQWIGASVYQEDEALAAIRSGVCDVLQVPYNLLDQRMAERVFPAAVEAGVGIIVRSVFLKGVLTEKSEWLPSQMDGLKHRVREIKSQLSDSWHKVRQAALQFCLAHSSVSAVLVGVRTEEELDEALGVCGETKLNEQLQMLAASFACSDEKLLNPSTWPVQ